jgi:hypothetical protein
MQSVLRWGLWVLSVIALLGAGVIFTSSQPVQSLCRTSCWFNDLLFVLFGELGGKIGLSVSWLAAAVILAALAYRIKTKAH